MCTLKHLLTIITLVTIKLGYALSDNALSIVPIASRTNEPFSSAVILAIQPWSATSPTCGGSAIHYEVVRGHGRAPILRADLYILTAGHCCCHKSTKREVNGDLRYSKGDPLDHSKFMLFSGTNFQSPHALLSTPAFTGEVFPDPLKSFFREEEWTAHHPEGTLTGAAESYRGSFCTAPAAAEQAGDWCVVRFEVPSSSRAFWKGIPKASIGWDKAWFKSHDIRASTQKIKALSNLKLVSFWPKPGPEETNKDEFLEEIQAKFCGKYNSRTHTIIEKVNRADYTASQKCLNENDMETGIEIMITAAGVSGSPIFKRSSGKWYQVGHHIQANKGLIYDKYVVDSFVDGTQSLFTEEVQTEHPVNLVVPRADAPRARARQLDYGDFQRYDILGDNEKDIDDVYIFGMLCLGTALCIFLSCFGCFAMGLVFGFILGKIKKNVYESET